MKFQYTFVATNLNELSDFSIEDDEDSYDSSDDEGASSPGPCSNSNSTSSSSTSAFYSFTDEHKHRLKLYQTKFTYLKEPRKRKRTTDEQLEILLQAFEKDQIPGVKQRKLLAERTGMTPRTVQVWFQNRRAKYRAPGTTPALSPHPSAVKTVATASKKRKHSSASPTTATDTATTAAATSSETTTSSASPSSASITKDNAPNVTSNPLPPPAYSGPHFVNTSAMMGSSLLPLPLPYCPAFAHSDVNNSTVSYCIHPTPETAFQIFSHSPLKSEPFSDDSDSPDSTDYLSSSLEEEEQKFCFEMGGHPEFIATF
jgi:hypothetical protein